MAIHFGNTHQYGGVVSVVTAVGKVNMDIKWIEDFLSLAQTRNFSRSAQERCITQPALSRRIKALEAWVGAELVDRSAYPLMLTAAGKLFQQTAQETVVQLHGAQALLRSQQVKEDVLRVAAGHALSVGFFPKWLKKVHKACGNIHTQILASNVHDSVLALVDGNCDLLLSYHHNALPITLDAERYARVQLGVETVVPVSIPNRAGRPAFALPGSRTAPSSLLAYTATSFFGRVNELILANADQVCFLQESHQSDMAEILKRMALEGYGLAWLPESAVDAELGEGRLVRAGSDKWTLDLEISLIRAIDNHKPALEKLWAALPAL